MYIKFKSFHYCNESNVNVIGSILQYSKYKNNSMRGSNKFRWRINGGS